MLCLAQKRILIIKKLGHAVKSSEIVSFFWKLFNQLYKTNKISLENETRTLLDLYLHHHSLTISEKLSNPYSYSQ